MATNNELVIDTVGVQNNEGVDIQLGTPSGGFSPGQLTLSAIDSITKTLDDINVVLKSLQDQIDAL